MIFNYTNSIPAESGINPKIRHGLLKMIGLTAHVLYFYAG